MRHSVGNPPSTKEYLRNLEEKESSPDFLGDMEGLLRPKVEYDPGNALTWVIRQIIISGE